MIMKNLKDLATDKMLADFQKKLIEEGMVGFKNEYKRPPVDDDELIRYLFSMYLFNQESPLTEFLSSIMSFLGFIIRTVKGEEAIEGMTMYDGIEILVATLQESLIMSDVIQTRQKEAGAIVKALSDEPLGGMN